MKYFDTQYNLFIADSDLNPLEQINTTKEKVDSVVSKYIISASGWRTVFALSGEDRKSVV